MSFAVVRCPACQGASQVDAAALGLLVRCPRCDDTFTAIEEAETVAPRPPRVDRNPLLPPPEAPRPRRRKRRERDRDHDRPQDVSAEPQPAHDPEHDPHAAPTGPLPASVLIGLALLPFAIPILWLVAPAVLGEEPVLSIATPISLAIAASVLCLAVIYTIDWTPATRIKGVLMLVCLSYFAAVSLYFLKKEMVDRIQKATGLREGAEWRLFRAPAGGFQVKMPGRPGEAKAQHDQPFPNVTKLALWHSSHRMLLGNYEFTVGSSPRLRPVKAGENEPEPGTDEWFDNLTKEVVARSGGTLHQSRPATHQDVFKGRELEIHFGNERNVRFVRVFFINNRVFYLSAEGVGLRPDEDPADAFFDTFYVMNARD